MIRLACLLLLVAPPQTVIIVTPRGETIVPISTERGSSAVAAPLLAGPLGLTVVVEGSRASVALGGSVFVFQLGAPFVRAGGVVYELVGEPYVARDTLIDLADRGAFCRAECDLFVSIHVNSMPAGRNVERTSGVETYFLSDAKTEDQERVAKMENEALRFESAPAGGSRGPVDFILKDLQLNEYLRESARLAELVQDKVIAVHPGGDRGVQQAGFMVLTTARRPAVLVETGFATNRTDGAFLASSLGQHKIASAIADGIVAYLLEFERKLVAAPAGGS